eukprot:TRINITY_DN4138_c0_g1_i1.p1 TRINITY_DN4138_c0_g1~~TRINITY_DN4138_c0_g1_i1.p1  ORF type:complete len:236 (-),score=43.09 TRINITY_DN4138_c0_g1_i1:172-879(-)
MSKFIFFSWTAFAGTHLYMSHPPNREYIIKHYFEGDEKKYLAAYSGISLAIFTPMTIYYIARGRGTGKVFWNNENSFFFRNLSRGIKGLALLTASQINSNPSAAPKLEDGRKNPEVQGISRITRHAAFTSFALWGIANCITRGFATDLLFWGGFPLFHLIGSVHQDYRQKLQTHSREYFDKTSLLPFKAIIEGRNSLPKALEEMSIQRAAIALLIGGVIMFVNKKYAARLISKGK